MPIPRLKWTHEQEVYLLSHYQTVTQADMAKELGVSIPSVSKKLRDLGIVIGSGLKSKKRPWSEYELNYLMEHFPHESAVDIGEHLGISNVMISNKAREMGLKKAPDYDRRKYDFRYVRNYKHNVTKYKVVAA
jgi:predicted transcriptional regulator